ncbi:enoyl-CoA hydratase/isomerase family protein [uncultured Flavonifractor sp.]|uniref:enoyl-CoA hydratase/isomerase family protein n=1 Tax=uncultured Flavonifractor sp. TaxID=1193534 RepID=UPI0026169808|nr:enoyl-CoA hydratase/isomerase family protein [uncultured Flavonifractor sp.]
MPYVYDKRKPYRTYLEEYAPKWDGMAHLRRDENGILEVRFHTEDGPVRFCEAIHSGYLGLLHDISHDPDNEIVILTGTGDSFVALSDPEMSVEFPTYTTSVTYDWWYLTATRVPLAWLDIPVPVICALNGPITIHPESVLLSDYIIAGDNALTVDRHIQDAGCAPVDGVNILYEKLLGVNAARALLLNSGVIDAQRGKELGIFAEVVPHGTELDRAWEFAKDLMKRVPSRMVRRMTREVFTQSLREAFMKDIRSSLCHECYSSELRTDSKPEEGHKNMINKEL